MTKKNNELMVVENSLIINDLQKWNYCEKKEASLEKKLTGSKVDFSFIKSTQECEYLKRFCESRVIELGKEQVVLEKRRRSWFNKPKRIEESDNKAKVIQLKFFKELARKLYWLKKEIDEHHRKSINLPSREAIPLKYAFEEEIIELTDIISEALPPRCDNYTEIDYDLEASKEDLEQLEIEFNEINVSPNPDWDNRWGNRR